MSKLQLIQQELIGINEAKFQVYCDDYFFWIGYSFITSSGSVIGKEKTRKGTPDTYIPINGDEYIFIEYTTKDKLGAGKDFYKKLSDDIDHCFDEAKSGIKNSQIKKVILCFPQRLKVKEDDDLRKKCNAFGAEFEPHGIDKLSRAALIYSGLSSVLNIPVDTQQMLIPRKFIQEYEKGKLATSLSNKLLFREDEINQAFSILDECNLLLISGNRGVGKTRLVLEIIDQFCTLNTSYKPICIDNKGCPLYEDARLFIHNDDDYILFVDDANRASKHYEVLINLLKEKRNGALKIIATVRNYASNIIEDVSRNFEFKKIIITPLTDTQIRQILKSDYFSIKDTTFIDVIVRVVQGNPRLALMAAKVASKKKDAFAFDEIAKIYDSYYDEAIKEVGELREMSFIKVLGIISFFNTIGKEYESAEKIYSVFEIKKSEFWEIVIKLHQMELVDLFENEVVKVSDQVFAMYFFYKSFIRDGILDFYILLENFYENYQLRFKDVLYPVVETFGFKQIQDKIHGSIEKAWLFFKNNDPIFANFLRIFWILKQDATLAHIKKQIDNLSTNIVDSYVFEREKKDYAFNLKIDDYFPVLEQFLELPTENYPSALDLIFLYLEKQPFYISQFVYYAKVELNFNKDDYKYGFYRQTTLFDKLVNVIESKRNDKLYRGIFYHITNTFLRTTFERSSSYSRRNEIVIDTFSPPLIPEIKNFRKKIWDFLFKDFEAYRKDVIDVVAAYSLGHNMWGKENINNKKELWTFDSNILIPFFKEYINKNSYKECKIVLQYFTELEKLVIPFDKNLIEEFTNYKIDLSNKLNQNLIYGKDKYKLYEKLQKENKDDVIFWQEIEDKKYNELSLFVHNYSLEAYIKLWHNVNELADVNQNNKLSLFQSFLQILKILAMKDINTFLKVLEYILSDKRLTVNTFSGSRSYLISAALHSINDNHFDLYKILDGVDTKHMLYWKFAFFAGLEEKYVNRYYNKELIKTFESIQGNFNLSSFDFLSKYVYKPTFFDNLRGIFKKDIYSENANIFVKVTSILLNKVKQNKANIMFPWDFITKHRSHFSNGVESLKLIYFENCKNNQNFDHLGKEAEAIFNLDNSFVVDFIKGFCANNFSYVCNQMPLHNFRFIWDYHNSKIILDELINFAYNKSRGFWDREHYMNRFFICTSNEEKIKKTNYLRSYIEENTHEKGAIQIAFNIITYSFPDKKLEFLKLFLECNQNPELFDIISFQEGGVYMESRVPIIEDDIKFLEQVESLLLTMPNSLNFVTHKSIVKEKIESLKREIKRERKMEFEEVYR